MWIAVSSGPIEDLAQLATEAGIGAADDFSIEEDGPSRLLLAPQSFSEQHQTSWESSERTGSLRVGLLDLWSADNPDWHLMGILAPRSALLAHVVDQVGTALGQVESVQFGLRTLLGPQAADVGLVPKSVRIESDEASSLVRGENPDALYRALADATGDIVGVTVAHEEDTITVLLDGTVIFSDDVMMSGVVAAITAVGLTQLVPAYA
jgi:hypothetical protein